jgi:RNA polymerase sigma-70 factor (ECF subfamily)
MCCPVGGHRGHIEFKEEIGPMPRTDAWFDHLYGRYRRPVLAFCLRRTGPSDAEDAVAEVFAVAWRRRRDVPRGDLALPWLYGVARNVLSHQWRSAHRLKRLADRVAASRSAPAPGPEQVIVDDEEHTRVRRAVARLRPLDREVLLLAAWEGLSHAEIAAVLQCSVAAVDKRLQRAKVRLKREWEALGQSAAYPHPDRVVGKGRGS